jgi:hypothetical protein
MQPNKISQYLTLHELWSQIEFATSSYVASGSVKLGYARLMYLMLCELVMHGHDSLTLISLLLLYRFANVLTSGDYFNC